MKNLTQFTQINKIFLGFTLLFSFAATAQVKKAFTPRFSETVKGNVTIVANNMLSRSATANYDGEASNHDFTDNVYVDIDNDNTTFNSSSANFVNPEPQLACLSIRKVYLYWAAADREPNGTDLNSENQPNWNYNSVKVMLPGQTSYTTLTATGSEIIFRGRDEIGHFSNDPYVCFKDITSSVQALASPYGKYQIANIEAKTGNLTSHPSGNTGTSGGWQIVFVYESPKLPAKNISLFDGYAHVTSAVNNFDINFNGFQTVPTGNVNADIVIGSLEGDRGLSGDMLQIRNVANSFVSISAPQRASTNFFNSRITVGNSDFTNRNPASLNTLGFDAAVFKLTNTNNSIITNNQTSATLRLTSNQETYGLYLLGLSVDVWEPNLGPIELVSSPSGTVSAGSTLGMSFNVQNNGNDDAVNLSISTTLPPQVSFIAPTSLPAGVTYTYNSITGNLTFNVANGLVDVGDPALGINFQLQVKDECYFLEDDCDLSFDLQFVATYNGVQNPNLQSTLSSNKLDSCNTGNQLPNTINIIQPAAAVWANPPSDLDRNVECDDAAGLAAAQALFPVTDKCDFTLTKTSGPLVNNPSCPNEGTYTNTWNFTDACGRTISSYVQTIYIIDTTSPILDANAADLTVECDANSNTALNNWLANHGGALAHDNCGNVSWSNNFTSLSDGCGNTGSATVTFTATDNCGNSTNTTATFTIQDTVGPTFTVPADITVECDQDINNLTITGDVTNETDACSTGLEATYTDTSVIGSCPNESIVTRTWTLTDDCGNTTTHDQTITVQDTTGPVFDQTLPTDMTVECDAIPTFPDYTATDNCGNATVSFEDIRNDGNCPSNYTLTCIWTATDDCGNSTVHSMLITVRDTTAPTFTAPDDITLECTQDYNDLAITGDVTDENDNCATGLNATFTDNITNGSCPAGFTITRTWSLSDDCNNTTTHTQIITIEDTTAPDLSACSVTDETIECNGTDNETIANNW
ncbi:MAG: hypothetical protein KDD03_08215, partial [Gelidibacter sp.]|nr:hypothetical protein [Gelidibacter sp.]